MPDDVDSTEGQRPYPDVNFAEVPPPPREGRGHRARLPLTVREAKEKVAGRDLLASYGAHQQHLRESAVSANRGTNMRAAAVEVAERNSQLEFIREWAKTRYVEEGTEGQFQSASDLSGGKFGRLAAQTGSVTAGVHEVFRGTPSSMSGFTAPLSGSSHNPPPPSQTVSGSETYPAFKPLPPGALRPPNQ
tara:strand:+ start:1541 stop:2110 length:570 start_codon:yes stop_codon:yes gene_type:complete